MKKYAEQMLKDPQILNELSQMILERSDYINYLKEYLKRTKKLHENLDLDQASQHFMDAYLYEFQGGRDIELQERYLNNMCFSYAKATQMLNTQTTIENYEVWQEKLDQIQIEDVLSPYMSIGNTNRNFKCPLHEDKTPSFKLYPATNSWYCFGCKKGGKPVNFIMAFHNMSYKEACRHLLQY